MTLSESPQTDRPVILAVDDDDLILSSLDALFRIETEYELVAAQSAREAEAIIRARPVDLVLSDFLMPEVNGVELLKRVRKLQPDVPRILLTGFADKENAIRGINEAGLYHYLEKPWDNESLLLIVRNALAEQNLRRELSTRVRDLDRLIGEHSELRDRHSGLERDLEMAARVQRGLLPTKLPSTDAFRLAGRYEPSAALGGDLYDVHQRGSAVILIAVDISGHGSPAALASTLLKASFHEAAETVDDPVELLAEMNRRLSRFMPSGMFACATVLRLEGERIDVAAAGLPHPRIRRASGKVERIAIEGLPLGLLRDQESSTSVYDRRTIELAPGDLLLISTDGLTEAVNQTGRPFEESALADALGAAGGVPGPLLDAVIQAGREHHDRQVFDDDVTLLAVSRKPSA